MSTCPICGAHNSLKAVESQRAVEVRGENFEVIGSNLECGVCAEVLAGDLDPLDEAFRAYRLKHGWKQPEEIRLWRERHGLTQKEAAKLLGWGAATISRYETGALQSQSHEIALEQAMVPSGLRALADARGMDVLGEARLVALISTLAQAEEASETLANVFQRRFGSYGSDILSGMRLFSVDRFFGLLTVLCGDGERKTKLNKLCFYADFMSFARWGMSLTGIRYARVTLGPVPDRYELYLAELENEGFLSLEIQKVGDYEAEVYKTASPYPKMDFSTEELDLILSVKKRFRGWTSTRIVNFSHEEKAWLETPQGAMISYNYSATLNVS